MMPGSSWFPAEASKLRAKLIMGSNELRLGHLACATSWWGVASTVAESPALKGLHEARSGWIHGRVARF